MKENVIGLITHYFPKVRAAVIKLKAPLSVGDSIKIKGHTTDFTQVISSMQIDRVPITNAKKGDEIGLLVNSRVRQHDKVCKQ
ncbi:MAG: translation elongation factor-like protein [Candidatus Omnitrophica bacterium]|nr:translation elongation factor-like protein [Candidatus Omnitrophota bacterium]